MLINGVDVTIRNVPHISKAEVLAYIALLTNEHGGTKLRKLIIGTDADGRAVLDYELQAIPFQRIRRITGYLVHDLEQWNDAKRAEERDRVKHGLTADVHLTMP